MEINELQKYIIDEFNSDVCQEAYCELVKGGLWSREKELIEKYFKPGSSVLDIGCGTGRTTIPLFEMAYKVLGVDISAKMIESAKKIAKEKDLKISYEVGDATRLRFSDNSWDNALFSNQGWTQIPGKEKRSQAFGEIYRVLKPGGYFIFTAHPRRFFGRFFFFWSKQWVRLYVLRRLGMKIPENEFGDRFFKRESKGYVYDQKQFIYIPRVAQVKKRITKTGFSLVENISGRSADGSRPEFFVCRKNQS